MRRCVREFLNPTTSWGKYIRPAGFFIYYFISKPVNFFYTRRQTADKLAKNSLYFFYDFDVEPVTYDFAWALCIANAKREALGLDSLKIIFVPGKLKGLRKETAEYEAVVNPHARRWRIYNILLPIIKLLPCPTNVTLCLSREEAALIRKTPCGAIYPEKYTVAFPVPYMPIEAMHYFKQFKSLQADPQALEYISQWLLQKGKGRKLIVITLRQYAYATARNSNNNAWVQFAESLKEDEYFVVFIADTEQSLQELPAIFAGQHFFQPASWNLLLRSALYELAYLNLGVNTGAMSLCWLNASCRYITFKTVTQTVAQTSLEVMVKKGYVPGENPRFAGCLQKWVWDDDNLSTIVKEFAQMSELIARNAPP